MTIWDCRTHVRMRSMTSSVERTDLDFKISVALIMGCYSNAPVICSPGPTGLGIAGLLTFQFLKPC